jgi:glycosyltransferase involved in cell wall biosynthesis
MKLLLVGSGDQLAHIEAARDRLGIASDCVFVPAQADVAGWMRSIDVFVMPSESEGFPNALLEAMACQCCVIASRVGGIPEMVSDGLSGLLFSAGNAEELTARLVSVVDDDVLRQKLSSAAARTAREKFSMELAARRTEALYTDLLNRRGVLQVTSS